LINTIGSLEQKLKVVVLSPESEHKQAALNAGADAFVNIGDPPNGLLTIIDNLFSKNKLG
jgi:hypothetical protein